MACQQLEIIQCQILLIHIYQICMIWFGLILWHINHCRLFNAKFSLNIYIKYILFSLVLFYGLSTSSSSSCRTTNTDIPDPLTPLLPIVHCFRQVLRASYRILTELLYVGNPAIVRQCEGSIAEHHELVSASPAVSCMSGT